MTTNSTVSCPLCATSTSHILTSSLRRGDGTVFYCSNCDHGFLVSQNKLDAKEYYSQSYRQEYSHRAQSASTNAREIFEVYRQYQRARLSIVSEYIKPNIRVLEVGASAGQFLVHLLGKVHAVDAIELDDACCDFLRTALGVQADSRFLSESMFSSERYDVVCSFQVMEHVENPVSFVADLRSVLKKGGVCLIEVPNLRDPLLSVWDVAAYRKFYYHSAHLHYFTESSLKKVALEAGFKPHEIRFEFLQDYNILNHLHWVMNNAPQSTCDVGLSEVNLNGSDRSISGWLTKELAQLNDQYMAKLTAAKATSNIMMVLANAA